MATLSTVLSFSRAQCQTDINGLTDANGIIFANEALVDFRRRLTTAGVDAAQLQEAYEDMSTDQGTYLYPSDMAWLKAIELNYGDTTQQNYITAEQIDVSNVPNHASFSWLRVNATQQQPYFNDMGDWFEIFPTPTQANSQGMRIWYFLEPQEYTATSDNIAYPESLDNRILGWRISSSYYKSLGKFEESTFFDKEYFDRTTQLISTLGQGTQQPLEAKPIQADGWNF